jgi:hypothetical protein
VTATGTVPGVGDLDVRERHRRLLAELAGPGDWWDGPARRAIMTEARARGSAGADDLPAAAVDAVHRVVEDSGRLERAWADERIAELGADRYAEVVGVTAVVTAVDVSARAAGEPPLELPAALPGPPAAERPDGVGDVGAWIPMTVDKALANVSRALSLVPRTNATWRALVTASYSRGPEMMELTWRRALTRPQVELVAAEVSRRQECFY